jgi:predicted acetyltransferase
MIIKLTRVKSSEEQILRNLLEIYAYELSQYTYIDVNDCGLFEVYKVLYRHIHKIRNIYNYDAHGIAYFVKVDNKLAGFVIINNHFDHINHCWSSKEEFYKERYFVIREFFIMHKYRRLGIGTYAVKYIFDKYKGRWSLSYYSKNKRAKIFWNKIINEHCKNGEKKLIKKIVNIRGKSINMEEITFEI